jgi:hypothetical protein
MSEIGPPQGNLFAAAVRGRRADSASPTPMAAGTATPAAAPPLLWVDRAVREAIGELIARARARPVERAQRLAAARRGQSLALPPELTIAIPFGFTVSYCEETQFGGRARHLTVSTGEPDSGPPPIALMGLMGEFGFRAGRLAEVDAAWLDDLGNGRQAVHLLERFLGFEPPASDPSRVPDLADDFITDPDGEDEEP